MIVMNGDEYLTAQEACALLTIKPATLYAYVSRGILRSYRQGIKRTRLYRRDEVESLVRSENARDDENHPTSDETSDETSDDDSAAWIPYV